MTVVHIMRAESQTRNFLQFNHFMVEKSDFFCSPGIFNGQENDNNEL